VDEEGHILCDKIKAGDREVSPNICRACPINAIHCAHLRATLDHHARPPLTVRWGNGKTEVWDDLAPSISLQRAACAVKVTPIHSPRDCAGCPLRQPLVTAEAIHVVARPAVVTKAEGRRTNVRRVPPAASAPVAPAADARTNIVAQKIIQLQEWLAKQKNGAPNDESAALPRAVGAARTSEEKRVGWTD
jgi:hypothetical protein